MPVYLLFVVLVIIACIMLNKITSKLGIPMLLAFILLGMLFGSDGILKIAFDNFRITEQMCSVALIFIMFYGGFGTKWSEAKPVALKAMLLSTVGVIITAGVTAVFCHYALQINVKESMLIGAVISSTDAASVFSVLRSKKLNLKYNTASMLEMESGSNDPCSYMLTVILLSMMEGHGSSQDIAFMIGAQLGFGISLGVLISYLGIWILKRFQFVADGFEAIFVLAIALLSYAAPTVLGGNGYLSAYIVGIALGNSAIKNKRTLVHFFDGVTGLMQMLIFFALGLLAFPSELPGVAVPAILIALFLTFIARPIAVFAILSPFRCKLNQKLLVSWCGLRGAASIVFVIMAAISPASTSDDLFHIIFCIVLFSILLQGSLIPRVAQRLNMIDEEADVFKTFTDYTEEVPVQFMQLTVTKDHSWSGKAVRDIDFPPDTLLILVQRNNQNLIPNGGTVIEENDVLLINQGDVPQR